jgi:peptidoglycan hydrolase-like protein with peptidoglycan-binding domain
MMSSKKSRWMWAAVLSLSASGAAYGQTEDQPLEQNGNQGTLQQDQGTIQDQGQQDQGSPDVDKKNDMGAQDQEWSQQQAQVGHEKGVKLSKLSRDEVRDLQRNLQGQGLYHGSIDGILGPDTIAAVGAFQQKQGLEVSGRLNEQTAQALGLELGEIQPVRGGGEEGKVKKEDKSKKSQQGAERTELRGQETIQLTDLNVEQRRMLQQKLKDQGFYKGDVNGQVTPETTVAIRDFQKSKNLPVQGTLDRKTIEALGMDYNEIQPVRGQGQEGMAPPAGGSGNQGMPSGGGQQGGSQQNVPPSGGSQQPSGGGGY